MRGGAWIIKLGEWISKNRRQVIAGTVMAFCIAAMFILPFNVWQQRGSLEILVGVFMIAAYNLHKRWWMPLLAFPLILVVAVCALGANLIASEIVSEIPVLSLPEVDVSVMPGGESIQLSVTEQQGSQSIVRTLTVTVCFYMPGDGPCVIAAHSTKLKPGDTPNIFLAGEILSLGSRCTAKVTADCKYGAVLDGPGCPEPDRKQLPLAGTKDVSIGERAVIHTLSKGDIPVKVMGFCMMKDNHFLVLELLDDEVGVGQGMSGSPLIQDGKIIGFLHSCTKLHRGPKFVMARPAREVYKALQEYLEP